MLSQESLKLPFVKGGFEVRLAEGRDDIEMAQALRYRLFFEQEGITPPPEIAAIRRDIDTFDRHCDHLIVVRQKTGQVVGNYRLMRRMEADRGCGFYSATEFDLTPLLVNEGLLELGRLCIDPSSRKAYVFGLLLRGLAAYVEMHNVRYLFGCASQHGMDADAYADEFKILYEENLAPEHLRARSLPGSCEPLLRTDGEGVPQLPLEGPLGFYLGLGDGAYVSDVLFVDRTLRCVDLLLVVDAEKLLPKVLAHFFGHREQ